MKESSSPGQGEVRERSEGGGGEAIETLKPETTAYLRNPAVSPSDRHRTMSGAAHLPLSGGGTGEIAARFSVDAMTLLAPPQADLIGLSMG
ncbi:MAG: hypothetical protein ACSHX3_00825 [Litorimonas sp.]